MARLVALLLVLISAGCADTIEPHYLQAGEDPGAAVRSLGYQYVEDASIAGRGLTRCKEQIVALAVGDNDSTGAHEYVHVQQQLALGCKRKGDPDREGQAYLAIWIYEGCHPEKRTYWLDYGVVLEDMDEALCD